MNSTIGKCVGQTCWLGSVVVLWGAIAFGAQAANPYIATGTFTASITAGTCTVTALDSSAAATPNIAMGDIYLSEVKQKSGMIPFKLKFSDCLGISTVTVSNSVGVCSGTAAQDDTFANTLKGNDDAAGVGLEIWFGAVDGGGLLHCHAPESNTNNVITLGASPITVAQTVTQDMNARIVPAAGDSAAMKAGMFNATVNFTLTYE